MNEQENQVLDNIRRTLQTRQGETRDQARKRFNKFARELGKKTYNFRYKERMIKAVFSALNEKREDDRKYWEERLEREAWESRNEDVVGEEDSWQQLREVDENHSEVENEFFGSYIQESFSPIVSGLTKSYSERVIDKKFTALKEEIKGMKEDIDNRLLFQRNNNILVNRDLKMWLSLPRPSGPPNESWTLESARETRTAAPDKTAPRDFNLRPLSLSEIFKAAEQCIDSYILFYNIKDDNQNNFQIESKQTEILDAKKSSLIAFLADCSVEYTKKLV
eukprot:gb/GECH01000473.1/.p1 GENE.gb/GECH01000473.1/~~gb/GECH01000473.1/.p1  ORF type:complete len:278 (+),score=43.57 gb/GECH01000473.1/:1-834(+)